MVLKNGCSGILMRWGWRVEEGGGGAENKNVSSVHEHKAEEDFYIRSGIKKMF